MRWSRRRPLAAPRRVALSSALIALLAGCGADAPPRLEIPPDVRYVATLELAGGRLVGASEIAPASLGRGPAADGAATIVGWRDVDGLPAAAIGAGAIALAADGQATLPPPSFAQRDGAPFAPPPLTVPGLEACPTIAPPGSFASLRCGAQSCAAEVEQQRCALSLRAPACGVELSGPIGPDGAWATAPAGACEAIAPTAPGAQRAYACETAGAACRLHVIAPSAAPRLAIARRDLFTVGPDAWPRDAPGFGWVAPPAVRGARVLVLERAAPGTSPAPGRAARLWLLDAETLEPIRTATAPAQTWRILPGPDDGWLGLEAGAPPTVRGYGPELDVRFDRPLPSVAGAGAPARYPTAADRRGAAALVVWSEVGEDEGLARATWLPDGEAPRVLGLDTPRVSGVAIRGDGTFVALDDRDDRFSLFDLETGMRQDSFRLGIASRPLRALVHRAARFESWIAAGGAVQPEVIMTGPGGFRAAERRVASYERPAEPWALAEWPAAPHLAVVGLVTRSGGGEAWVGLFDPRDGREGLWPGLARAGEGPIVGGAPDAEGRVWMALPAEGAVVRIEPW